MFFDTLEINNFGPFSKFKTQFNPTGITVISGPAGTGKTQLVGSILFSLFGMKCIKYVPNSKKPCSVILTIGEKNYLEVIQTKVKLEDSRNKGNVPSFNRKILHYPDVKKIYLDRIILESFFNINSPNVLISGISRSDQLKPLDIQNLRFIKEAVNNDLEISKFWAEFENRIKVLCNENDYITFESFSQGGIEIFKYVQETVKRKNSDFSFPLIIDNNLQMFDYNGLRFACKLISDIAQRDQVIILTSNADNIIKFLQSDIKKHIQLNPMANITSNGSYSYYSIKGFRKIQRSISLDNKEKRKRFILGEAVSIEENRFCEFKEIKGKNPISSIIGVADHYVVAFLNSRDSLAGSIYWGIKDENATVIGVTLNLEQRDKLRRVITEKLCQIQPPIAPTAYRVELHQVYDKNNKKISDLYIVEIVVPPEISNYLYSNSKDEVYVKTDGGKKKLTSLEIQKETLKRNRK